MKLFGLVSLTLLLSVLSLNAQTPMPAYNEAATVQIMRDNLNAVQELKKNLTSKNVADINFTKAAQNFILLATNALAMEKAAPPKGSTEDWAKTWNTLAYAAFKGVGACGEKSAEKALAALEQVGTAQKSGHKEFK